VRAAVRAALALAALAPLTSCVTSGQAAERAAMRAKERAAPALVHVRPVKEVFAGGRRQDQVVQGSGFIISPDGYAVTNEHVAGDARLVRCVLYNKAEVEAQVVGSDRYTDLAVLKLDAGGALPSVDLGDSDALRAGQTVLALGSPHGLSRSVSLGVVSVTGRYLPGRGPQVSPYNTWIQTDAAINQGNSGGPLVNLRGEVVGVNARMLSGAENVGFAIPANTAREVVEAIIRDGKVVRSTLGLSLQEMTRATSDPNAQGVIVGDVDPLSPAAAAGIKPGDVLLSVNGKNTNARFVEDLPRVRKIIADLPVGSGARLVLMRGGERVTATAETQEKTDLEAEQAEFPEWGFTAGDVTPQIARAAQLSSRRGVIVTGVETGGAAANAGLTPQDLILTIDEQPIANLAEFRRLYADLVDSGSELVLLDVKRGALTRFVLVEQGRPANEENVDRGLG
jgi:serine protease Do